MKPFRSSGASVTSGWHQSDYGDLILPFTVFRRLDAAAAADRERARAAHARLAKRNAPEETIEKAVEAAVVGKPFYNVAPVEFEDLLDDPNNLEINLRALVDGFSPRSGTLPEDGYLVVPSLCLGDAVRDGPWTVRRIAERSGISPTTVLSLIHGSTYPDLRTIARIETTNHTSLLPSFAQRQAAWRDGLTRSNSG